MEEENTDRKRLGKNREWKAVADYRKWKKSLQKKKTIVEKRPGSFEGYGRKVRKKTESPESIFAKKLMRDLKKFNRKNSENRRRRIR